MLTSLLDLYCHVRPGANALVSVFVDGTIRTVVLEPTIEWVASSSKTKARKITVSIPRTGTDPNAPAVNTYKFKIKVAGSDVLICGYEMSKGRFEISSQPVWDDANWQPYDFTGHTGDDAQFQGNGSLQILAGQTVEFDGTLFVNNPPAL